MFLQNECVTMCLGVLRCTHVARNEVQANIPPLRHRRDALLLSYGIKTIRKAPLGNTASKIIWQPHRLHNAVHRPVSVRLDALCRQTGMRLDDADRLVLPTLPPWKKRAPSIITSWIRRKKAVVAEAEHHQRFRALVAGLPPSLHICTDGSKTDDVWVQVCGRVNVPSGSDCRLIHRSFPLKFLPLIKP